MTSSQTTSKKPGSKRFNASLPFSHKTPYDSLFSERIPLLQAMHLAVANCLRERDKYSLNLLDQMHSKLDQLPMFRAVECGVYTGSSLLACVQIIREYGLSYCFHGLDTFTGLPQLSSTDKKLSPENAKYRNQVMFEDTSLELVEEKLSEIGERKNVILHQGLFNQTLPSLPEQTYHFVNIDCDLYEPHLECLEYFYPRVVAGGVIFFDDYYSKDYPMAGKAIDAFMKDKPEDLFHLRYGEDATNRTKAFIIKY